MRKPGKGRRKRKNTTRRMLIALIVLCAALATVVIMPGPTVVRHGQVELKKAEDADRVYGPEIPEAIVEGYVVPNVLSSLCETEIEEDDGEGYVYTRESKKDYHRPTCKFAYASGKHITPYEAYFLGYKPGTCCNPPVYTP